MRRALCRALGAALRGGATSVAPAVRASSGTPSARVALLLHAPPRTHAPARPLHSAPASLRLPACGAVWRVAGAPARTTSAPLRRTFAAAPSRTLQLPACSAVRRVAGVPLRRTFATAPDRLSAAREHASSQLSSFWAAHHRKVYAGAALLTVVTVWRSMFWVASSFLNFSESLAEAGLLALAASLVAATGTGLFWRWRLNPEAVYRAAMKQLRASPDVRRALGSPLTPSDTRAFVLSGGGVKFKQMRPVLRSRRCHLLFPLAGPLGRAIVSAEAKKESGQHVFKLLALDVASATNKGGPESRLFLVGDQAVYQKGQILGELRDPLVATIQQAPQQEREDEVEEGGGGGREQAARAEAEQQSELYAWDHFTSWLAQKRAAQAQQAASGRQQTP